MYQLSDELLKDSYKSALELNLHPEFILLMKLELERRALIPTTHSAK